MIEEGNTVYDSRENCNAIIETATNTLIQGCKTTTIPNSVTRIGESSFSYCTNLTSITIPRSVTSIGNWAFCGCTGLISIVVDDGNTIYDSRENCNAIIATAINTLMHGCKTTVIPDGITGICFFAFLDHTELKSITIPNSVTNIEVAAFSGCTGLSSISVLAEIPPILYCSDSYTDDWEGVSTDIPVYIPCGTKEVYQANCGWGRFSNYIEPVAPYSLTVTTQDEMMGTAHIIRQTTCANDTAVFEAVANDGYHFTQWSDGNTDNPRTIVVDEDITLIAQFVSSPTAIDNTSADTDTSTTHKVLRNGQVYILHNGKTYTLVGVEVK